VTPPVHVSGALTNADYARSGVPRGTNGTVFIAFRVRSDGRVDRCRVVRSSGNTTIDRETCRLVERRFRFRPARDAAGRAIDFALQTDFTWHPRYHGLCRIGAAAVRFVAGSRSAGTALESRRLRTREANPCA
jgi:TonB family protein